MSRDVLKAVGETLVAANNDGSYKQLIDTIYDVDCVSVESAPPPGGSAEACGIEAIKGKWAWWEDNHDVHETEAHGPYLHGDDRFGVVFTIDVTDKSSGERVKMQEIALYTVNDGKIVREEFFY
ncbi:nuclear transport factor 2 family protein [Henriciella marina]|uniref:Nuclear transport factor 2 family protein n=1 Tax=Henriciella marina TaxID=453851 RepID=A0ABT4LXZ8_9PROT|nr:nuclear transport factor 2 family protein [Henriciella marina]MCH2458815.1 nuclear transport factor 2 family protein [Henriciella sp.]MCZ4299232.1 nuclear transport factor 2 family protein [Henriciella marina]